MSCRLAVADFKNDQEVRWCPGCGDHAILASVQKAFPLVAEALGYEKERFTVISGIGCSSRFPYYVDTFGFHSIHARATAISTGVKTANPKLSVWQITGDGDALAIGGNHFIHAVRRNVDINILLFNNEIYGLTKGQYSPTSKFGAVTKTSPYGTVERPFIPGQLVIGAKGTFFARSLDVEMALSTEILVEAAKHDGTSVVEFLQNCVIFNDGAYTNITDKAVRDDRVIYLKHGEPMVFGKNRDKGLILNGFQLKAVQLGKDGYTEENILRHDAHESDTGLHMLLAGMNYPTLPVALGVIRNVPGPTYDQAVEHQQDEVREKSKFHCVDDLLRSGETYEL